MRPVILLCVAISLLCTTSAFGGVCDGYSGAAQGLCNAYCAAMQCGTPSQHAADNACTMVGARFQQLTGALPPCACDIPGRIYTSHDPVNCLHIEWGCPVGTTRFFDQCGCGCATQ